MRGDESLSPRRLTHFARCVKPWAPMSTKRASFVRLRRPSAPGVHRLRGTCGTAVGHIALRRRELRAARPQKVRNSGAEARAAGDLRRNIFDGTPEAVHTESTKYRGAHVIECFLVVDGQAVAYDRHPVTID